jgi:Na+-translocating ferredoxin:NAD+ oxidoreductase RnfG subunit
MDERYLYDSLNYSVSLYKADYSSSQNQMKIWQNVLICVFSICSVALFALVYSPMIQKLGQETKQAWSMCSLIPQEYQEEFKYLNKVIRERRDNFVWR